MPRAAMQRQVKRCIFSLQRSFLPIQQGNERHRKTVNLQALTQGKAWAVEADGLSGLVSPAAVKGLKYDIPCKWGLICQNSILIFNVSIVACLSISRRLEQVYNQACQAISSHLVLLRIFARGKLPDFVHRLKSLQRTPSRRPCQFTGNEAARNPSGATEI